MHKLPGTDCGFFFSKELELALLKTKKLPSTAFSFFLRKSKTINCKKIKYRATRAETASNKREPSTALKNQRIACPCVNLQQGSCC
jgi:hypothetical protein